jgi:transmembrane sensor
MYTPADCRDTLRISVEGEVYLEVNRLPSRPLVIPLAGSRLDMDRGHINLKASADSCFIRATLIEGVASIHGSEKEITLLPGQQALVKGQKITLVNGIDIHQVITWMK